MLFFFYESNNIFQERVNVDDKLGLEDYMERLLIEDGNHQEQREVDPKNERSLLALPPPQQEQEESSQDLPRD